jgi:A/G-specific adenine glycosylase
VLCRFLGIQGDPHQAAVQARLWQAAKKRLPAKRAGAFNQALMELGALVCTARDPQCWRCPLARGCVAHRDGLENTIPPRPKRLATVHVQEIAVVLERQGRLLLVRRPDGGRWAGLWEFPHTEQESLESSETAAHRLLGTLGVQGRVEGELATIRHAVTRFRITLICVRALWQKGMVSTNVYPETRWVEPEALTEFPISSPQRRLVRRSPRDILKSSTLIVSNSWRGGIPCVLAFGSRR